MTYYWQTGITVGSEDFKLIASEQLRNCGYTVLGGENILFGEDKSAKAQYQLGGTVKDIKFNSYAPLAGNFSEANISVEWQVLNALRKDIIFTLTTTGYGKQSTTGVGVIRLAFGNALCKLLADNSFVDIIAIKDG